MVTLAHISDVHLAPLPTVRPVELANKRITGYLNWKLNRAKHMQRDTLTHLLEHLKSQQPDLTAITGDLVNLALDAEFTNAANWIKILGTPEQVCAIPGNHDAYVPGAREKFCAALGQYASGELIGDAPFPYVRRIGDIAVIGCSSAVATPPFFASGAFDPAQASRLKQCLNKLGDMGFFRVVLIHHPPNRESASHWRKGLRGAKHFRKIIAEEGAELILHGHTHRSSIHALPGPKGEVPVVGVAAGSADTKSGEDPARYNLFEVKRTGDTWSCTLREYGYQRIGDEIVLRLQMHIY